MVNLKFLNTKKLANFIKNNGTVIVTIFVILIAGYFGYDYYVAQKELSEYRQDSDVLAIKEKNDLLKTLNKLVLLPTDEEPTIATVSDATKLHDQKFFVQAENGDKVVIYPKSQRAVLYRPSIKKIIESAPVSIGDLDGVGQPIKPGENIGVQESTPSNNVLGDQEEIEETVPAEPAKIAIYNGTLFIAGLANDVAAYIENELGEEMISIDILSNANEVYEETLIIDVTGRYPDAVGALKDLLSGKIEEKPQDVEYPDVDIVVVAGKDILENENIDL